MFVTQFSSTEVQHASTSRFPHCGFSRSSLSLRQLHLNTPQLPGSRTAGSHVRHSVFVNYTSTRLNFRAPALRVLTFVTQSSSTEVLHATAKRAQRRGFLGGACGLRNFELAPPKGFLSLQTETKLQPKSTKKTFYKALTSRTIIRINLYVIIGEVASPRSCGCISHLHIRDGCHCLF